MSETVSLPALGESVTEGTVTRWLKNVGDRVEVDEPLLEVSTDKVDTEVPSPISGVVEEILVAEDETVDVGTVLVRIGDGSGQAAAQASAEPAAAPERQAPAPQPAAAEPAPVAAAPLAPAAPTAAPVQPTYTPPAPVAAPQPTAPQPVVQAPLPPRAAAPAPAAQASTPTPAAAQAPATPTTGAPAPRGAAHAGQYVTPIVRKLASEQGVDLDTVAGSGVGGRIRKEDVLQAATRAEVVDSGIRGTREAMSALRRVTAERAVASLRESAQATCVKEVDVTDLMRTIAASAAQFERANTVPLGFLPFVVRATAEALRQHPMVNASVTGDTIVYPEDENICLTVDTDKGILTPVLRGAANLSIAQVAKEIVEVTGRVAANTLRPDELVGGTFTITDSGARGALFDTPVVFLPQVAALGVGEVTKRPAVVSVAGTDAIAIRSSVFFSLSYDQRIIDSAQAARFLTTLAGSLGSAAVDGVL